MVQDYSVDSLKIEAFAYGRIFHDNFANFKS